MSNPKMSNPRMSKLKMSNPRMSNPNPKISKSIIVTANAYNLFTYVDTSCLWTCHVSRPCHCIMYKPFF